MIHAFRALHTIHARRTALAALVDDLSPSEWRELLSRLNARSFQLDIVGALPLELVAHVFSYLDTSTPFRLQRVSRRWHALLRNLHVLQRSFNAWVGATSVGGNYSSCVRKAQTVHRLRSGQYVAATTATNAEETFLPYRTVLSGDVLAGVSSSLRSLLVINLQTRISWQTHGNAREIIIAVAASDSLVAYATTRCVCYVSDLAGSQKKQFKLRNPMFHSLACRGRTVLCGGPGQGAADIYVWDFDTQKGKSFQIGYNHPPFADRAHANDGTSFHILPALKSKSFTIMTLGKRKSNVSPTATRCSVWYTCFTFDCQPMQHGTFLLPDLTDAHIIKIRPVNRHGRCSVAIRHGGRAADPFRALYLEFDEPTYGLTSVYIPDIESVSSGSIGEGTGWWEDSFYQVLPDVGPQGKCSGTVLLAHLGTSDNFRFKPVLFERAPTNGAQNSPWQRDTSLLLNDRHAVVLDSSAESAVHILSFEAAQ